MQVHILDKTYDYDNNHEAVEKLFLSINEILKDAKIVFLNMLIDGTTVDENHYQYIMDKLTEIKNVRVEMLIITDEAIRIILSTVQYLDRAIPETESLIDKFYLGAEDNDSIDKLGQLLEGLQWIISMAEGLEAGKDVYLSIKNSKTWDSYVSDSIVLKDAFGSIKDAVMNMDKILVADILKYEIIDILKAANTKLKSILNSGE